MNKIDRVFAGKGKTVYTCYKVFEHFSYKPKVLSFWYYPLKGEFAVPTGKWIDCNMPGEKIFTDGNSYPSGFHCFAFLKDAKNFAEMLEPIRKIKARGLLATGRQDGRSRSGLRTMVFKEIFVPRQR